MSIDLTPQGRVTAIDYALAGAPDFQTGKASHLVRPSWCTVKWFNGAIGKIEVHGNVVSRTTGEIGNRTASETFLIRRVDGDGEPYEPAFVAAIFDAAEALEGRAET